MNEISEEVKEAYLIAIENFPDSIAMVLARALRDTLARALKAEFWSLHDEHDPESCLECDSILTCDAVDASKYHDWTEADWQAEADKVLKGES